MSLMDNLAQVIAQMEGYNVPNSLAQRNNNPGNLREGLNQTGTSNGYATFASPNDGWNALYHQLALDANRGLSLEQFISKYAPSNENDTSNYLSFVTGKLNVDPSILLSSLWGDNNTSINPPQPSQEEVTSVEASQTQVVRDINNI